MLIYSCRLIQVGSCLQGESVVKKVRERLNAPLSELEHETLRSADPLEPCHLKRDSSGHQLLVVKREPIRVDRSLCMWVSGSLRTGQVPT